MLMRAKTCSRDWVTATCSVSWPTIWDISGWPKIGSIGRSRITSDALEHFTAVGAPEATVESIEWVAVALAGKGLAAPALRLLEPRRLPAKRLRSHLRRRRIVGSSPRDRARDTGGRERWAECICRGPRALLGSGTG